MPGSSTGGRSGNVAMSERLPPIASTVRRRVESKRSLRCSSRETPCWLMPSTRATLSWVSWRALRSSRSVISSAMSSAERFSSCAAERGRGAPSCRRGSRSSRSSMIGELGEVPVRDGGSGVGVGWVGESAVTPARAPTVAHDGLRRRSRRAVSAGGAWYGRYAAPGPRLPPIAPRRFRRPGFR